MTYTMKEVCDKTGLTYETLKFYCNKGLIPNVIRDKNNRRLLNDESIEWINGLQCLKRCGMTLTDIKSYIDLCREGVKTIPQRKEILNSKKELLIEQMKHIQKSIDYIDNKQRVYDNLLNSQS